MVRGRRKWAEGKQKKRNEEIKAAKELREIPGREEVWRKKEIGQKVTEERQKPKNERRENREKGEEWK